MSHTFNDRATIAATVVLQILADAELELDFDPRELKLRLELYLRAEFDDLAQQIIAEREGYDNA